MNYKNCPQCQKSLRKSKDKQDENLIFYKCSKCKYSLSMKDKEYQILFDDGEMDFPRIRSEIYFARKAIVKGVPSVKFDKISDLEKIKQESDTPDKEKIVYVQFFFHNPSFYSGGNHTYVNLEDDYTIEKFYENFLNWFNS